MSKSFFDISNLKTIVQGALGAMTFGAYHQFVTNKMMEINNENMDNKHKSDMSDLINKNKTEISDLSNKYNIDLLKLELKNKYELDKLEMFHKEEMKHLLERMDKLEKSKSWW
jgi:hypothetical protein